MMIDDEKLMAFADGELSALDRAAMERALADDPGLREKLAEQQRLRSMLSSHYGPVAAEEVPERLLTMLGATNARAEVASLGAAREKRRRPTSRTLGTIAASLAVGLIAGQMISSEGGGPVGLGDGALVARGDLARALDTQLASAQAPDAATRIGVSFADRQGRYCRSFDAPAVAGLACHEGGDWRLVMIAPPTADAPTQYRQAGSSIVLQAAQEMMASVPLDAAAERTAREAGWERR